jgi:hypothetical protein
MKKQNDWEKWIDKETCCDCPDDCHLQVKKLIHNLLKQQKKEIIKEIENIKRDIGDGDFCNTCGVVQISGDCHCEEYNDYYYVHFTDLSEL